MGSELRRASPLASSGRGASLLTAFLLAVSVGLVGCVNKDGEDLPQARMAFPIAIELSTPLEGDGEPEYAFVANSNFDLAFNVGSVQSYSLDVMVETVDGLFRVCQCAEDAEEVCESIRRECPDEDPVCDTFLECERFEPGECEPIPPDRCAIYPSQLDPEFDEEDLQRDDVLAVPIEGLLVSEVRIGSFADGMALAAGADKDGEGDRLYLPVRSDANLTFIDTNEKGELKCGSGEFAQADDFPLCEESYRSALVDPNDDISVPSDPVDVYVGNVREDFPLPEGIDPGDDYDGNYVIMAHRNGAASFFLDQTCEESPSNPECDGSKRPRLIATIDELAPEQVTVTYEPGARIAWIPSANTNAITRVGIALGLDPSKTVLFDAGELVLSGLDTGIDARDVLFDPRPDRSELAYVLSRSPESILVTTRDPVGDELSFLPPQIPICSGPSRLQIAPLELDEGTEKLLAFVTCFNGRKVEIVDLDAALSFTRITNVSGAFEFEIDASRERLYLADFSTSTLRVFDLAPLKACLSSQSSGRDEECAPTLLGIVGIPQAVSELPR